MRTRHRRQYGGNELGELLITAIQNNDLAKVKELLEAGVDVNYQNKDGDTALMDAADAGHLEIVRLLLDKGANPDVKNIYGYTALLYAAWSDYVDIVKYLLNYIETIDNIVLGEYKLGNFSKSIMGLIGKKILGTKQTSTVVPFVASNAYLMQGHGSTLNDFFIVPDNCIIIAKAHPGQVTYTKHTQVYGKKMADSANAEIFRNPLKYVKTNTENINHMKDLVKLIGDFVMFKPGDVCPNFSYTLCPSYNEWNTFKNENILPHSEYGLLTIPLKEEIQSLKYQNGSLVKTGEYIHTSVENTSIFLNTPVKEILTYLYRNSIYPTTKMIETHLKTTYGTSMTPMEGFLSKYDNFKKFTTISQKELLKINEYGIAKRPGVYYNFVCRAIPGIDLTTVTSSYNCTTNVGCRPTVPTNLPLIRQPPQIQTMLKQRIAEVEESRKHTAKLRNNLSANTRNARYAKNISSTLLDAAKEKRIQLVKKMIDFGADPNVTGYNNNTPLIYAASNGGLEIVRLLLDKGANPDVKNINGDTALSFAANTGHLDIVRLLLDNGANPNITGYNNNTPLIYAALNGELEIVRLLLDKGANPNIANKDGFTSLIYAANKGLLEIVRLLLDRGANPDIKNRFGVTALWFAAIYKNVEVVKYLLTVMKTIDDKTMEDYNLKIFSKPIMELIEQKLATKQTNTTKTTTQSNLQSPVNLNALVSLVARTPSTKTQKQSSKTQKGNKRTTTTTTTTKPQIPLNKTRKRR